MHCHSNVKWLSFYHIAMPCKQVWLPLNLSCNATPDLLVHEAALKETVVHIMCDEECTIGQHVHDFLFVTISLLDSEDDLIFCNISGEGIGKCTSAGIVSCGGSVNDKKCILPSPELRMALYFVQMPKLFMTLYVNNAFTDFSKWGMRVLKAVQCEVQSLKMISSVLRTTGEL